MQEASFTNSNMLSSFVKFQKRLGYEIHSNRQIDCRDRKPNGGL